MEKEDVLNIEQMIKSRAGIGARAGTIENELPALHQSYFHALNAACAQEEPDDDERFCQIWVQKLFEAGASEEDELLQQTVHGYVLALLYRKRGEPKEVGAMYGHVADMLCKKINAEEHEEFMQAQEIAAGINFSVQAKEAEAADDAGAHALAEAVAADALSAAGSHDAQGGGIHQGQLSASDQPA